MAETSKSADQIHSYAPAVYAGLISSIQLPGMEKPYQVHDPDALHDASDLGLGEVIIFGGVVKTESELPALSGVKVGTVYYIQDTDKEVICVSTDSGKAWEEFGSGFVYDHNHKVEAEGVANVSGTVSINGTVSVSGSNQSSAVTGKYTVPTVAATNNHIYAYAHKQEFMIGDDKAITGFGAHKTAAAITDLNTTTVKSATATDVSIPNVTGNASVTASYVEATAVSASKITENTQVTASHISDNATVTASKISKNDDVTIKSVKTNSDVTASKITSNSDVAASKVTVTAKSADKVKVGSAASWNASVVGECLTFSWTANVPSTGTAVDVSYVEATDVTASKVVASDVTASKIGTEDKIASKVTASDVTASKITASEVISSKITNTDVSASLVEATDVQASKVTLGTAIGASKVTTANVTVATGAKTTANAITELGTPTTKDFLTSVDAEAPLVDLVLTDDTTLGNIPVKSVDVVIGVTVGSEQKDFSGTAAAQKWSGSGSFTWSDTVSLDGTSWVSGTTIDEPYSTQ